MLLNQSIGEGKVELNMKPSKTLPSTILNRLWSYPDFYKNLLSYNIVPGDKIIHLSLSGSI